MKVHQASKLKIDNSLNTIYSGELKLCQFLNLIKQK
jgi:hypothetical protein